LEYAADDVRYLPRAATLLREKARTSGIEAWLDEELKLLDDSAITGERSHLDAYRRIRGSGRLGARSLAVLRELAAWRELEAQNADLPRQHVAEDTELLAVASVLPTQTPDFEKCRDLRRRTEERHSTHLLAAVHRGLALPESDLPQPAIVPDERTIGKERISATVEAIRKAAEARQVDARLVSSKSDVVMLLHEGAQARPHNHRLLRGWRAELLTGSLPVPQ
jgi:ribonuclease D